MNFRFIISSHILGLLFATIQAQSCDQPSTFTFVQAPTLDLCIKKDGSITNMHDISCDKPFVLCNINSPHPDIIPGFRAQADCPADQTICSKFQFTTSASGKKTLQCFDLKAKKEVSLIGIQFGTTGIVLGGANDQLTSLQQPVSVITKADPCGFLKDAPKPPPPISIVPSPPGKEGALCSPSLACEKGLCCRLVNKGTLRTNECQKCSTPAPSKPAGGSCDSKTGKGCKFVDCSNDGDCPSGMSCIADDEDNRKVCSATSAELSKERNLLGGNMRSYTENIASGNLNDFALYNFASKFAFAVYHSENKQLESGLCQKYNLVKFLEVAPQMVALGVYQSDDKKHVVVSFRGTKNDLLRGPMNWFTNLNILPNTWAGGNVAQGFLTAYQSIDHELLPLIDKLKPKSISITGHSLGGALSQMLVVDMLYKNSNGVKYAIDSHVTFGMPHTGDEAFQKDYEQRSASIKKAHFVAQNPSGRLDLVSEVSPTFSPITDRFTLPVKLKGLISMHNGYQATFNEWEHNHLSNTGKCSEFNAASSPAPPPGPTHGPTKPPTPQSGPKCTFKKP